MNPGVTADRPCFGKGANPLEPARRGAGGGIKPQQGLAERSNWLTPTFGSPQPGGIDRQQRSMAFSPQPAVIWRLRQSPAASIARHSEHWSDV